MLIQIFVIYLTFQAYSPMLQDNNLVKVKTNVQ